MRKSRDYLMKCLLFVLLIGFIALGTVGGCNNNNGGGDLGADLPGTSGCPILSSPCVIASVNSDKTIATCALGNDFSDPTKVTCAADLMDVIAQVGNGVTANTTMWITAFGGSGGNVDKAMEGSPGVPAQTTTSVSKLMSMNNNSSIIYYFVGSIGSNGGDHCGAGGGASTIVTLEDLTLNPTANPTQSAPPVLLVAGGGGGGSGGNGDACGLGACTQGGNPGCGGLFPQSAISDESMNANGPGSLTECGDCAQGGNNSTTEEFAGGAGCEIEGGDTAPTKGTSGIGGMGGRGGNGQDCGGPGTVGWTNTGSVTLSFANGMGGNGGGGGKCCDSGGGGGGGGAGGGGGGGHGNANDASVAGGDGGSFAIKSELSTTLSGPSIQENPCLCPVSSCFGCVTVQFCLTPDCEN